MQLPSPGPQLRSLGLQQSRSSRDVIFIRAPRHPALAAGAAVELPRHDFEFVTYTRLLMRFTRTIPRQILWQIVGFPLSSTSLGFTTVSAGTGSKAFIGASKQLVTPENPLRAATQNNVSRAGGSPLHKLFSTLMAIRVQQ